MKSQQYGLINKTCAKTTSAQVPVWVEEISQGPSLDKKAINGCWVGEISLLQGQGPWQVIQSQMVSLKYMYIRTLLNGLSRVWVCVLYKKITIKEEFINLRDSKGDMGRAGGEGGNNVHTVIIYKILKN